jgi:hypothetical protein
MNLLAAVLLAMSTECRGAVAFHYGPALTPAQMEFFGRFDVLVTHDPLPEKQVAELHRRGTKLALYEWSVAFYRTRRTRWDRHAPVLNERALRGGVGASDADAFYYDPAAPRFAEGRSRALAAKLRSIGYDGVFFDTLTEQSVHPDALAEYRKRHPDVPYDQAFARFLAALREKVSVIITNQGYRVAEHYLPYADYDVSESLFMRPAAEIDPLMQQWILPTAAKYPRVKFVHLNYVEPGGEEAVERMIGYARAYGHEAYVAYRDVRRTAIHEGYFECTPHPPSAPSPLSEGRRLPNVTTREIEVAFSPPRGEKVPKADEG